MEQPRFDHFILVMIALNTLAMGLVDYSCVHPLTGTPYTIHPTPIHHTPYPHTLYTIPSHPIHHTPYTMLILSHPIHHTPYTIHHAHTLTPYTPHTMLITSHPLHHTPCSYPHTPYTTHHTPHALLTGDPSTHCSWRNLVIAVCDPIFTLVFTAECCIKVGGLQVNAEN
jgi:hypothetical protein